MSLISNMRMYGLNPKVVDLWKEFSAWVSEQSGIPIHYIDHPAPAPIDDLWQRSDMGLVFMCGWPYWRQSPKPTIIAAPVIDHEHTAGSPVYWTEMVVRADSEAEGLEDTFGGSIAWTIEESHSGCNAPRHSLLPHFLKQEQKLYTQSIGPVVTPRGAIEAVLSGKADVAPVDSYFHLLLQRHEPETFERLKTIARTENAPVPLLVGAADLDLEHVANLQTVLKRAHEDQAASAILAQLAIKQFVLPDGKTYALAETWHEEATSRGYALPS